MTTNKLVVELFKKLESSTRHHPPTSNVVVHALFPHDDRRHPRSIDNTAVKEGGMWCHDQDWSLLPTSLATSYGDGHTSSQV